MARTRSGQDLINDAYKKADLEAFTDRYPRTEVLRYVNQGGPVLWGKILDSRARTFGRSSTPWEITTEASTTEYSDDFPDDFLNLLSVRLQGPGGEMINPLLPAEEAFNLEPGFVGLYPEFYELVPGALRLLPEHQAGLTIIVDYIVGWTDLTDSSGSTFDGINGYEEYLALHAAREMLIKEGEPGEASLLKQDMLEVLARVAKEAPKRDAYRPRRVRDIRGERMLSAGRWYRR